MKYLSLLFVNVFSNDGLAFDVMNLIFFFFQGYVGAGEYDSSNPKAAINGINMTSIDVINQDGIIITITSCCDDDKDK